MLYELRPEILIRIAFAFVSGIVLGYEREQHGRAAGLRTTILVCVSACLAMILSESFYLNSPVGTPRPDPARLAAGTLSGMGFLGAGVIIRQTSYMVRGVTTAATLWCATVIGLALGAGSLGIGLAGTVAAFIILYLLPWLESFIKDDWYSEFTVSFDAGKVSLDAILAELKSFQIKVKGLDLQSSSQRSERKASFRLKFKKTDLIRFPVQVTERVGGLPGVLEVHWHD
jgi:putative Mg2+ transporter-C (MgtC) family protein